PPGRRPRGDPGGDLRQARLPAQPGGGALTGVRPLLLKAAATGLTLVATAAAAVHVGGHLRRATAPLHPGVIGGAALPTTAEGRLTLTPSVRSASVEAVTSSQAS